MNEPAHVIIGEMEFLGWLGQAQPGQAIVYHRGFLAMNRRWSPSGNDLHRLADRAIWAAEHGLVDLVQRRHGPEDATYLAIARPRTTSISNELGS